MEDEFHGLGTIQVEPQRRPLGLDKMFLRARNWKHGTPSAPIRPPSPPPGEVHLALPAPLHEGDMVSPLAGLFQYPELVPLVLEELKRPGELATAARVCSQWNMIARRRLYANVWVRPWEDAPKRKLLGLFTTLNESPALCKMVRSLDVRFFPLDMQGDLRVELEDAILNALSNMTNIEKLVWTRDRSISSELFQVITSLKHLTYLELSGHSTHYFDPHMLRDMHALRDLRVMMPDTTFRAALPSVIKDLCARPGGGLHGLALVCKSFNLINDQMLAELAPFLSQLKRLMLIGATRVSRVGVYELLRAADGLEELVLDAPPHSELVDLSDAPPLDSLHTFSLSFPAPNGRAVLQPGDMPVIRPTDTLRALELNLSSTGPGGGQRQRILPIPALATLQEQIDFTRLTRLALLNLVIDQDTLAAILASTPALQELYIAIATKTTLTTPALDGVPLRILHANAPEQTGPSRADLAFVASILPKLEQIGSLNRVYEVHRRYDGAEHYVDLARWSQVTTPGYFQVWRP